MLQVLTASLGITTAVDFNLVLQVIWLALPFCLESTVFSGCDALQGSALYSSVGFIIS